MFQNNIELKYILTHLKTQRAYLYRCQHNKFKQHDIHVAFMYLTLYVTFSTTEENADLLRENTHEACHWDKD